MEHAEILVSISQSKIAFEAGVLNVGDDEIGLPGGAVGNHGASNVGKNGLHVGLIEAEDGCTVERDAIYKLCERSLDFVERGVVIEMLAVNGGDDGDDGSEE
jgi:hypothetical protein